MARLSESAVAKIEEICSRYTNEPTPLMMILSDIQNEYGYIPLEAQELVSEKTGISVAEIYCLGTACYVKGGGQVFDKFAEVLGIKGGETTPDGLFTLDALRCLGACGIAPAVSINGKVYPKVKVSDVPDIVASYRNA